VGGGVGDGGMGVGVGGTGLLPGVAGCERGVGVQVSAGCSVAGAGVGEVHAVNANTPATKSHLISLNRMAFIPFTSAEFSKKQKFGV